MCGGREDRSRDIDRLPAEEDRRAKKSIAVLTGQRSDWSEAQMAGATPVRIGLDGQRPTGTIAFK